ncbi:MAG: alpha/beta fold hydrolase [Gordonia sp. (in: high G+C Gram-positive bacteria)]|uniref:alpha/beta fold hydrolase n=1 Tax=Gordonia sp. (in: high G+C Gram-positive bacteria) TaxID=84139 RepID=UPI0039E6CB3E
MTEPGRIGFDLDDVSLRALTWGDKGAPLALCLHGYPDTAWTWRHLGPELAARGYYAVAPFSRGYAPSTAPTDVSTGSRVADALDIAAHVGAQRSVVIGHDWGAFTANALAAMPDQPFAKMVSMAVPPLAAVQVGGADLARQLLTVLAQSGNSWYIFVNQFPVIPERVFSSMTALLWRRWSPGYDATEDIAHLADAAPADHRSSIVGYYRQLVRPKPSSDRHRELNDLLMAPLHHPILQLYGATDGCLRTRFFEGLADKLPTGSRVERIEHGGHFMHLEQPAEVNRLVLDYLA